MHLQSFKFGGGLTLIPGHLPRIHDPDGAAIQHHGHIWLLAYSQHSPPSHLLKFPTTNDPDVGYIPPGRLHHADFTKFQNRHSHYQFSSVRLGRPSAHLPSVRNAVNAAGAVDHQNRSVYIIRLILESRQHLSDHLQLAHLTDL